MEKEIVKFLQSRISLESDENFVEIYWPYLASQTMIQRSQAIACNQYIPIQF